MPVAAFAAAINEAGSFKFGYKFSYLRRHGRILPVDFTLPIFCPDCKASHNCAKLADERGFDPRKSVFIRALLQVLACVCSPLLGISNEGSDGSPLQIRIGFPFTSRLSCHAAVTRAADPSTLVAVKIQHYFLRQRHSR